MPLGFVADFTIGFCPPADVGKVRQLKKRKAERRYRLPARPPLPAAAARGSFQLAQQRGATPSAKTRCKAALRGRVPAPPLPPPPPPPEPRAPAICIRSADWSASPVASPLTCTARRPMARRVPRHWLPAGMSIRRNLHAGRAAVGWAAARVRRGSGTRGGGGSGEMRQRHTESLCVITTPSVNPSPASCVARHSVSSLFARVTARSHCVGPAGAYGLHVQNPFRRRITHRRHTRVCVCVCVCGVTLDP